MFETNPLVIYSEFDGSFFLYGDDFGNNGTVVLVTIGRAGPKMATATFCPLMGGDEGKERKRWSKAMMVDRLELGDGEEG